MYRAIILPLAKLDIAEAAAWYNSKQKGLGKQFAIEVRSKVLFIRENPKTSAVRYDDTRCAVLDVFPFMIHYTIDEANKTIIVAAVFHTSLNSERWKKR
jgi:plasmid stabilization system protein ParE